MARFNFQNIHELQPVNLFARTTIIPGYGREQGATRFVTGGLSDMHTFTPNFLGEFRAGFNRWKLDYLQQDHGDDVAGRVGRPACHASRSTWLPTPEHGGRLREPWIGHEPAPGGPLRYLASPRR